MTTQETDFCNAIRKMMRDRITPSTPLNIYKCVRKLTGDVLHIKSYYLNFALDIMNSRYPDDKDDFSAELKQSNINKALYQEDLR